MNTPSETEKPEADQPETDKPETDKPATASAEVPDRKSRQSRLQEGKAFAEIFTTLLSASIGFLLFMQFDIAREFKHSTTMSLAVTGTLILACIFAFGFFLCVTVLTYRDYTEPKSKKRDTFFWGALVAFPLIVIGWGVWAYNVFNSGHLVAIIFSTIVAAFIIGGKQMGFYFSRTQESEK